MQFNVITMSTIYMSDIVEYLEIEATRFGEIIYLVILYARFSEMIERNLTVFTLFKLSKNIAFPLKVGFFLVK